MFKCFVTVLLIFILALTFTLIHAHKHMTYDDAVIQWWEQVNFNHAFSVEQLSALKLMKSNLKWLYDKHNLTLETTP